MDGAAGLKPGTKDESSATYPDLAAGLTATGPPTAGPLTASTAPHGTVYERDAFLCFRALCKLSIHTSETVPATDSWSIKGKVLALELLKVLLENSGPVLYRSDKFMSVIKDVLCVSLLRNSTAQVARLLWLSCSIFVTLVMKFRAKLKAEVGLFFPMILLRAIEP